MADAWLHVEFAQQYRASVNYSDFRCFRSSTKAWTNSNILVASSTKSAPQQILVGDVPVSDSPLYTTKDSIAGATMNAGISRIGTIPVR